MNNWLPATQRIASQPSWVLQNDCLELAVTELGAHMAPVTFCRNEDSPVQPYYISPWQGEQSADMSAAMMPLRGDFFCLPFGGNEEEWDGEKHPEHGETAGNKWSLQNAVRAGSTTTLHLQLKTKVRPGTVDREFTLMDGHNAVYCRTVITGFRGPTSFAHHAILALPEREKALKISTSPFAYGSTYPVMLANPSKGEYQSLATDTAFKSLAQVQSIFKQEGLVDCSAFPSRPGFCDLIQQFDHPSADHPSWVVAVNTEESWMWFALKNAAVMPGRLFWMENKGRHGAPWNGRNKCLGIEDGCMYFGRSIAESCRPNPVNQKGFPTCVCLNDEKPYEVRYIQGAVNVPAGFDEVTDIEFTSQGAVFRSGDRFSVSIPLHHDFLFRNNPSFE